MHRSFQTAIQLFQPEIVFFLGKTLGLIALKAEKGVFNRKLNYSTLLNGLFYSILGDIFDEGQLVSLPYFNRYVERFRDLFAVPASTKTFIIVGNHDIGFHYR